MDYSDQDCQNSFTQGQTLIMRSVLENERIGLLNSPALSNCVVGLTENNQPNTISIYPNPTNGIINISSLKNMDLKITFYNSLGEQIQPIIIGDNQYQINKQGIYFISIQSNTLSITEKIIIQ